MKALSPRSAIRSLVFGCAVLEATPTPTATVAPMNTPAPGTTPSPTPSDPECQGIPPSEDMEIVPGNCAPAGTHFDFTSTGFTPGEDVQVYITDPNGQVFGAPFFLTADGSGRAGPAGFSTTADFPTGLWTMNMVGLTSGHQATGFFKLTAP